MADEPAGTEPGERPGHRRGRRRDVIAAVLTGTAVAAAVVHMVKPDIRIDGVTAVLLVVAVVPWLGSVFDSIELPGGARFQYRQLVDRVEAAEEHSAQAGRAADDATRTARVAFVTRSGEDSGAPDTPGDGPGEAAGAVGHLASEYTGLRAHAPSGAARTARMEQIFADLVTATRRLDDFDIRAALRSADPGTRLAGYARLYARPDGDHLDELTQAVLGDEQYAFSQYWGFHAIAAVVDKAGAGRLRLAQVEELDDCLARLPADSDRIPFLRRLLAKIRSW